MMTDVRVSVASSEERDAIANLYQFYSYDFSEFWPEMPRGELMEDGRFAPYPPLDSYWREKSRVPLIIRQDGNLAGFALLNRITHSGQPVDHNMAEFFVVRRHRRGGVGSAALDAIFRAYKGAWEVAVLRANTNAFAFWDRAIARHPLVRDLERHDLEAGDWDGPIFRFRVDD